MCLNSEATKKTYSSRLRAFFDFLKLEGDLDQQGRVFLDKARADSYYVPTCIMSFINYQKKRAEAKEIAPSTIQNFYKPIKSFLEVQEDVYHKVSWNRLRSLDPSRREFSVRVRRKIDEAMRVRIPPMTLDILKEKNRELYEALRVRDNECIK